MHVDIPHLGTSVEFPDGTPHEQIEQELNLMFSQRQHQQNPALAIAQALQPAFTQFAQQAQAPASTIGSVGGGANAIGLTPEQTQGQLDSIQQDNQFNEANRLQQEAERRATVAQQQEIQKDRQQELKLEKMQFQNEQAAAQLKADRDKDAAILKANLEVGVAGMTGVIGKNIAQTAKEQGLADTPRESQAQFDTRIFDEANLRFEKLLSEGVDRTVAIRQAQKLTSEIEALDRISKQMTGPEGDLERAIRQSSEDIAFGKGSGAAVNLFTGDSIAALKKQLGQGPGAADPVAEFNTLYTTRIRAAAANGVIRPDIAASLIGVIESGDETENRIVDMSELDQ